MNGKYKGLEYRAEGTYCVPGLQEAVSELILPSATGKSVPAGFHLLQEDNSGLHSLQGGRRGWSRDPESLALSPVLSWAKISLTGWRPG